jgi:hypothetical protein
VPELVRDHDRQRREVLDVGVDVHDARLVVVQAVERQRGRLEPELDRVGPGGDAVEDADRLDAVGAPQLERAHDPGALGVGRVMHRQRDRRADVVHDVDRRVGGGTAARRREGPPQTQSSRAQGR